MKFKLVLFLLSIILTYSQAFHNGPVINLRRNTQNLNNHNNRNIIQNIPARFSQAHSTSQITASEKIATSSYAEAGAGAGENPIFTLNIHAPQETTDEIIDSIKDLKKLVQQERKNAEDDFLLEKKKLVEAQRIRVRDIVHSGFEAVNALIPNPIKSEIRKTLKSGKGSSGGLGGIVDKIGKIGGEIGKTVEGVKGKLGKVGKMFGFTEKSD